MQRERSESRVMSVMIAGAAAVAMATSFAAIADGSPVNTPGWQYGQANCGPQPPSNKRSEQQCKNCCDQGVNQGDPDFHIADCYAYCAQVPWEHWSTDDPPGEGDEGDE